jgi:hypothetical protein
LTIVEDGQRPSSESTQNRTGGAKTRGSRRPKVSLDEEREIARLYADASTPTAEIRARFAIGESSLYRIIQRQGISLRGHISAANAPSTQPARSVKTRRKRAPVDGRQVAQPRIPAVTTSASGDGTKFRIRYLGERVFEARNIRDALRQAEALGATEVVAVARED